MEPTDANTTYFEAWAAQDFDRLRSVLHDAVTYRGPLGDADGAEACLAGLRGLSEVMTELRVLKVFTNGPDVLTWFDLYTGGDRPASVAQWSHVEDGQVARIRVAFDPRTLLAADA